MRLFKNLKARILKSIIMWSEMGKQIAQAKEVYCHLNITFGRQCKAAKLWFSNEQKISSKLVKKRVWWGDPNSYKTL